jgi:hypothetical protein
MYCPKATEDQHGQEPGGGRVALFAGDFLRFNNKGTHKTPRERYIVMQILGGYPTGRTAVMLGAGGGTHRGSLLNRAGNP